MEKLQEGIVLEVNGDIAKVKASRHNDCDNCGACPGNMAMVLEVRNTVGAKKGQMVAFEIPQVGMLKAAFIVYILPLLSICLGVALGTWAADYWQQSMLMLQIGGGFLFFMLSLIYVKFFDRNARSSEKMQPVTIRILSN